MRDTILLIIVADAFAATASGARTRNRPDPPLSSASAADPRDPALAANSATEAGAGAGSAVPADPEWLSHPEPFAPTSGIVPDTPTKAYRTLSVVMPVYNERNTLKRILARVLAAQPLIGLKMEVVMVDDASRDGTKELLAELAQTPLGPNRVLKAAYHEKNQGKGAALRTGFAAATGDIILVQDADMEYDPRDYPHLIRPIVDGVAKVVYGSRWLNRQFLKQRRNFFFRLGNWLVTAVTNWLYGSRLTDEPTCYKVFDADLLRSIPLRCRRFEFCPEVTAKVLKRGVKIWETPIYYYPRTVAEGKKIKYRDGLVALWTLLKYRFVD